MEGQKEKTLEEKLEDQLNDILSRSKLSYYQNKIEQLKKNPSNFESMVIKIKRELKERSSEFSSLKDSLELLFNIIKIN